MEITFSDNRASLLYGLSQLAEHLGGQVETRPLTNHEEETDIPVCVVDLQDGCEGRFFMSRDILNQFVFESALHSEVALGAGGSRTTLGKQVELDTQGNETMLFGEGSVLIVKV